MQDSIPSFSVNIRKGKNARIATIRSYAKINWFLRIGSQRDDGYHNIDSLMQLVNLYDEIEIYQSDSHDRIECNLDIPTGPGSMLAVLLETVRALHSSLRDIRFSLRIRKHIPLAGGLGGGSSNVAALLRLFSRMAGVELSQKVLLETSSRIGSDVPFFASEVPFARIRGRGENVIPLLPAPQAHLVLVFPGFGISTAWAFAAWDEFAAGRKKAGPGRNSVIDKYNESPSVIQIESLIMNDFEKTVFSAYPQLKELKKELFQRGCSRVFLSGSGSTLVGVVREEATAINICRQMKDMGIECQAVQTLTRVPEYLYRGNSEGRKGTCPTR